MPVAAGATFAVRAASCLLCSQPGATPKPLDDALSARFPLEQAVFAQYVAAEPDWAGAMSMGVAPGGRGWHLAKADRAWGMDSAGRRFHIQGGDVRFLNEGSEEAVSIHVLDLYLPSLRLQSIVRHEGLQSVQEREAGGWVVRVRFPPSETETYAHPERHQTVSFTLDAHGRVVATNVEDGGSFEYSYGTQEPLDGPGFLVPALIDGGSTPFRLVSSSAREFVPEDFEVTSVRQSMSRTGRLLAEDEWEMRTRQQPGLELDGVAGRDARDASGGRLRTQSMALIASGVFVLALVLGLWLWRRRG